ncbi:hypothetical protein GEV33_003965 [Tenebrio molitor]|uniref:Odorant receptor n=1 Tax=Tenebrio molitor TaxID=7067 RepID=A0A8J6LN68_TENMO|nr:hypothetical protein GEV33_003965 [Tenebrio molitor]
MSQIIYLDLVYNTFKRIGLSPTQISLHNYILPLVTSILVFLVVCNFQYLHHDIFEISRACIAFCTHSHALVRQLSMIWYSSEIEQLLKSVAHFWDYDLFGKDLGEYFRKKMTVRLLLIKCLFVICVGVLSYLFLSPLVFGHTDLPQESWIPGNNHYAKVIIYVSQIVCLSNVPFLLIVFDGTLFFLCNELEIQFLLLKKSLQAIKIGANPSAEQERVCLDKLKNYSIYHLFLLRVHEKLKTIYSDFFLFEYLVCIEALCILFCVLNESTSASELIVSFIYMIGVILQCAFAFLAVSNLEAEAATLSDALYDLDWYNSSDKKIPRHILFMLMKAQQPVQLTGAGLISVNRNTFLQNFSDISYSIFNFNAIATAVI